MAPSSPYVLHILVIIIIALNSLANPNFHRQLGLGFASASTDEFSLDDNELVDTLSFHGDYSPPSPPAPARRLTRPRSRVMLSCPVDGCSVTVNMSGEFSLGLNAVIIAGTVSIEASNATLFNGSLINVTALAGPPPEQTSGTPTGTTGAGGGHGGRGASCVVDNKKLPEDVWGGDVYSWSSLGEPWSYGSKGGTTNREEDYGGKGGGRIGLVVMNSIELHGNLLADGGEGGIKGGGGSGGSIKIKAPKMSGGGNISACGGNGFAGGGGGRVSVHVFSRHDDPKFFVHEGGLDTVSWSYSLLSVRLYSSWGNKLRVSRKSGAAGTFYDAVPRRLIVSNHNMSTDTDTLLLEFPNQPLWTNVYIQNHAKATVPLLWKSERVLPGQHILIAGVKNCDIIIKRLLYHSFGLVHYALSEFELTAEELLMSDSVYGSLRMSVKIQLMWNSKILIDGDGDAIVATSLLEASNLVVLRESSVIHSNANLGVHGQGFLNLSGPGDVIEAQRLVVSLFYGISVGPGSVLRGPLENASSNYVIPRLYCELQDCPKELLHPPEDCNVNSSLSFTLEICRVEDVRVEGIIEGSVVHFHWVRTVDVQSSGAVSASGLGCTGGVGRGRFLSNGLGGGGGHGGKGGSGYYNGSAIEGGVAYGNADLPCEHGSGSGNDSLPDATSGGGIIVLFPEELVYLVYFILSVQAVMGSLEHSLSSLSIDGSLRSDGGSFGESFRKQADVITADIGPGGGSGGTILLFVHTLALGESSSISTVGGHGGPYSGGGGGGRIHFHWADIPIGDDYMPIARVKGAIHVGCVLNLHTIISLGLARGGIGRGQDYVGENGTVTGKACPKGLYGIFCQECPVGSFKNVSGSDGALCRDCPSHELPHRAVYISKRGGVVDTPCPYKCISDRYHMPHCYTALEELIYTFGGPWLFGFILVVLLILLALVLSVARIKFVNADELPGLVPTRRGLQIDRSFPFLESLKRSNVFYFSAFSCCLVLETSRAEESQTHVHRMYFMGPNAFGEPWHLAYSPPEQVTEIVYEDAFNIFVDEINALAAYQWWEGSVYSILSPLAYPLAWSWLQWRQKMKIQRLREFVRSEYDHACLRSCRSRALYEGLKHFAPSPDSPNIRNASVKGANLEERLAATADLMLAYVDFFLGGDEKRADLPPQLHQRFPMSLVFGGDGSYMAPFYFTSFPPTIWFRLVAGLNAQLRLVRRGHLRTGFRSIMSWLETHGNPTLSAYGVRVDLASFQPTACGYHQFGLIVSAVEDGSVQPSVEGPYESLLAEQQSCLLGNHGRKAVDDLVGLVISILLLGDFSLVLLTLLQLYSISLLDLFLFLFILPLGILFPFPAGINALFSHGARRASGLARFYALWNIMSLVNVVVAFICGFGRYSSKKHPNFQPWNFSMDESGWWMLPSGLVLCKVIQARLINYHVANLEIQDRTCIVMTQICSGSHERISLTDYRPPS
ncbi:hypothetical protein C3L33_03589, partial [Rhododendron williamsianum]